MNPLKSAISLAGVGISTVGRKAIKDAHVTAEFCANSQGFIESMVTEAIKDGPKGYSVRKEVVVSDYNKPYALPVPRHQDCDMKVRNSCKGLPHHGGGLFPTWK